MSQRAEFIKVARAEIGTKENPPNSNKVKYNKENGLPWCGYFVTWCAEKVGLKLPNLIYTPNGVKGFQGKGLWTNAETSKPLKGGEICFFDFPGGENVDHVGIVIKDNLDGTVVTVEGNTIPTGTANGKIAAEANGGEVCMKVRAYKKDNKRKQPVFIVGFGQPQFKD